MPLVDRATNLLDLLSLDDLGAKPIVFICHSLGGLVVKQMLRQARDFGNHGYARIATSTRAIAFLSTPHSGADIATWVDYMGTLLRTTVSIEELRAHAPALRDLNLWYRHNHNGLKTIVYCEKQKITGILVVNESTADPGIPGVIPVPVDEDHSSICKPDSRKKQVYRGVRKLIGDVLNPL